jgi:hypothetical protein
VSEDVKAFLLVWVERVGVTASVLLFLLGAYLTYGINFSGRPLPQGLKSAILAMEVPSGSDDIRLTVGCGLGEKRIVACTDPLDRRDRDAMRAAQYADMFFIPLYVAVLVVAGITQWVVTPWHWRRLGAVTAATGFAAGVLDYFENAAILETLDKIAQSQALDAGAIANFAWWKWGLLFVSLFCLLPLMLAQDAKSMTLKIFSRVLCVYAAVSCLAGFIACWFRHPTRLESASPAFVALPVLILLRSFLRDGTLEGLTWLAGLWGLRWLARWPEFLFGEEEDPRERSGQQSAQFEQQQ